jgi:small subunit ribosomal protein S16
MAVKIRLRRMGSKNRPFFRVIAADVKTKAEGRHLELLGWYDPKSDQKTNFQLKLDRVEYWISKGAQLSPTVTNLVRRGRRAAAASAPASAPA